MRFVVLGDDEGKMERCAVKEGKPQMAGNCKTTKWRAGNRPKKQPLRESADNTEKNATTRMGKGFVEGRGPQKIRIIRAFIARLAKFARQRLRSARACLFSAPTLPGKPRS